MYFKKYRFFKKIICLGLSAALTLNTAVPASAQEFFYNNQIVDRDILKKSVANISEDIKEDLYMPSNMREDKKAKEDEVYARALQIKRSILGDPNKDAQQAFREIAKENGRVYPELERSGFQKQLVKELEAEAQKIKNEIISDAKKAITGITPNEGGWINYLKNTEDIQNSYEEAIARLDEYLKQEIEKIDSYHQELLDEVYASDKDPDAFFNFVKPLFAELISLYKNSPDLVKEHILELTPLTVSLTNQNGERVYEKAHQKVLLKLYREVIDEENNKLSTDKKKKGLINNTCEITGYCPALTSAILGLSVLSPEAENNSDGELILNAVNNYHDTAANVAIVSSGISALTVMKQYDLVDQFLDFRTKKEGKIDFWDYLNFASIPQHIANVNGKYLGTSSSKGQYYDEEGNAQNVYFEIAQILAEDNSKESLNILRKYGAEKCLVKTTSGVEKGTLAKYSVSCSGIMPFLVGALVSGKSGAGEYNLPIIRINDSSEVKAVNAANSAYKNLVKDVFNGDAEAMLALHVMTEGMGDLDTDGEYTLDTMLNDIFGKRIPKNMMSSKRIIIDEERSNKKQTRQYIKAGAITLGFTGDIILTISCVLSLPKLGANLVNIARKVGSAGKGVLSFGKGLYLAFREAKLGFKIKNVPEMWKITRVELIKKRIISEKLVKMRNFFRNYKAAVSENVLYNAAKYTSEADKNAEIVLGLAKQGTKITPKLADVARNIIFDEKLGTFVFTNGMEKLGYSKQVMNAVKEIVDSAAIEAKSKLRVAKLFKKNADYGTIFLEEVQKGIANSRFGVQDKQVLESFFKSSSFQNTLKTASSKITLSKKAVRDFTKDPLTLDVFEGKGKRESPLAAKFVIADKMPAFSEKVPDFTSIVKDKDNFLLKFFRGEGEVIDFSAFKLAFGDTESVANLARISSKLGKTAGKIEIKFIPKEAKTFWFRNVKSVFVSSKDKLFGGKGKVFLVKDGKTIETGISIRTYKKYNGLNVFVQEDLGGVVSVFKGAEQLPVTVKGSFYLPKYQIRNFMRFAKADGLSQPFNITLLGGKNKINALYFQSVVSLSAASTGLVGPLRKNYPELRTEQLALIALVFPYLLSALTPFVSPLVKRYGAINILKVSMGLSLLSLALPIGAGFTGFNGIQSDSPFEKPSPLFLYPSALLIGLATTLTRGSYSSLIQAIGGGSGTLKAVAFKSISGFILILPPVLGEVIDNWKPRYFLDAEGNQYLNKKNEPIKKKWFDFSFSYPVIFLVAGSSLFWLQKSHFNPSIGRELDYTIGGFNGFLKEARSSYGILFSKHTWPLTVSSALLAGAESSLLYSYATSKSNEYVRNRIKMESLVPVIAMLGIGVPAFFTRIKSKPYLRLLGGDTPFGYRNMTTLSLAFAGSGTYLMKKQDNPAAFTIGMALTAIGFSQITSSILRYGHVRLEKELKMPTRIVTSWDVSYPTVFFGMSFVPWIYGEASDFHIKGLTPANDDDMISLKNTSAKDMMGIPAAALVLGGGFGYLGMFPRRALNHVAGSRGLLGGLGLAAESNNYAFKTLTLPKPEIPTIQKEPQIKVPNTNFKANFEKPRFNIQPIQ